jgi:hypothetical protein
MAAAIVNIVMRMLFSPGAENLSRPGIAAWFFSDARDSR